MQNHMLVNTWQQVLHVINVVKYLYKNLVNLQFYICIANLRALIVGSSNGLGKLNKRLRIVLMDKLPSSHTTSATTSN